MAKRLPKEFRERLKQVTGKRARIVVDHILKHGFITTEELKEQYGYDHPPRAKRDVVDQGIPIETFSVQGTSGRRIGAYRFGDPSKLRGDARTGRRALPKQFKAELVAHDGAVCAICSTEFEDRYLQIDHRVPYEVGGDDGGPLNVADFMLVCGSCNRAKSWSCEHCPNWLTDHDPGVCRGCYWGSPEKYVHIALREVRRLDIVWEAAEVPDYEKLVALSKRADEPLPDFVKAVLKQRTDP